jgi:hypothetical protein
MRIRQGNDFIFLWTIERNELPEDFSNAENIRLHFKNFDYVGEVRSFQIVDGNIVRVEVSPEWASRLGAYRLILSYEFEDLSYSDGDRKCVVDVLAFNIVPKTSEADDVTEMAKTTDIMIGLKGDKGIGVPIGGTTGQQLMKKSNADYDFEWKTPSGAGTGDMLKSEYDKNDNGIVDNAEKVNGFTVETNVPADAKFTDTIYSHPETHPASIITETTTKRFVTDVEKADWTSKETPEGAQEKATTALTSAKAYVDGKVLTDVPLNAKFTDTVYTHPETHPASIILQNSSNRFVSDAEKLAWDDKVDNSRVLTDVPANAKFTDTIVDISNKVDKETGKGLISTAEVTRLSTVTNQVVPTKLSELSNDQGFITGETIEDLGGGDMLKSTYDTNAKPGYVDKAIDSDTVNGKTVGVNVPANALFTDTTYEEITEAEINTGTASTLRTITARRVTFILSKVLTLISNAISALTKSDVGLGNLDNIQQATKEEFNTHDADGTRHITAGERSAWGAKWDYNESTIKDVKVNNAANADTVNGKTVEENVPSGAKFTDTVYTHPTGTNPHSTTKADVGLGNVDNTSDADKPVSTVQQTALDSKQATLIQGSNITITESTISAVDTTYGVATTSVNGLMSSTDKSKLNDIASNANNYSLPTASDTVLGGVKIGSNISILDGVISVAAPYTHPATHPYSMITGAPTSLPANGGDSATVNGKTVAENVPSGAKFTDTVYSHPTSDGNLHVPATGTTNNGKVLKAGATAGSLVWETDNDTITTINGKTGAITKADIVALGLPAQDTVYTHPAGTNPHGTTKADVGLGNVDNTSDLLKPISDAVQTALDGKVDNSRVLTDVPANAKFTDTIYSHPASHPATIITQTSSYRFVTDEEKSTWNAKSNLALGTTSSTAYRGDYGDIAYTHSQSTHAPANAQKNSDITKAEIEEKLTGAITSHTHSAYVPTSRTVAGKALTGNITLAKGDVSLGNVDNTSDANKPVSTAQDAAIALKIDASKFQVVAELPASPVTGVFYFIKE